MTARRRKTAYRWIEGSVDAMEEHFVISHGDQGEVGIPVAIVGKGGAGTFVVQFQSPWDELDDESRHRVKKELDFYLVELGEPDPWLYAGYHCGTFSNVLSQVHWGFEPRKSSPCG